MPRKNIRLLAGKPLIAHAIEAALAAKTVDRVIVSTEDSDIAEVARQSGAEVPFLRPAELARDDSPELLAWQHALRFMQDRDGPDAVRALVSVPATSPLRTSDDVDACTRTLLDSDADVVVTVTPSDRSPYFNMVSLDDGGFARLVIPPSAGRITRRQDAPQVYNIATAAYAARPHFVLRATSLFDGKVKAVVIPADRAVDIDSPMDFDFAEFLLQRRVRAK